MTVFHTIVKRRSIGKMLAERPTRQQIERLLEAATHAPNHHNAQPWRFLVLAGESRNQLGEIMAEGLLARITHLDDKTRRALLEKERNKLLRAPVIIVAVSLFPKTEAEVAIENIEAVAAGVQNMLLTAEELGLGAMWRTGDSAFNPHVKTWLGLNPQDEIVAFVYVGYPAISVPERVPTPFQAKTTWLDWEE
jgi:nitroreductase